MPKRSSKKLDINQLAAAITEAAIGTPAPKQRRKRKNPSAVALGRLGGKKGGPARAKKLTKEQRSEIARNAALARYGKKKP
jgi:hypothetical protein